MWSVYSFNISQTYLINTRFKPCFIKIWLAGSQTSVKTWAAAIFSNKSIAPNKQRKKKKSKTSRLFSCSLWCHNIPKLSDRGHFLESGMAVRKVGGRPVKVGVVISGSASPLDRWLCDSWRPWQQNNWINELNDKQKQVSIAAPCENPITAGRCVSPGTCPSTLTAPAPQLC